MGECESVGHVGVSFMSSSSPRRCLLLLMEHARMGGFDGLICVTAIRRGMACSRIEPPRL